MNAPTPDRRAALFALEQIGIKLGLEQMRALVAALDHPDRAFRSVTVAGTNGKGSVTAMVERGLRAAGCRTGRYVSPHLVDLEERFAVNGQSIPASVLDAAAARVLDAARPLPRPPSFFEATTALAFDVFRGAGVDVAVLEVGLGGRLDATNIATQIATAITAVDFDHEQFLGDTIDAIAQEKAGVIKPGGVVVLAANPPAVTAVVAARASEVGARLVLAEEGVECVYDMHEGRAAVQLRTPRRTYADLRLGLRGRHQVQNAITAVRLLEQLGDLLDGYRVDARAIRIGVEDVIWPARLELVRGPAGDVLIDGAHNPAGARALSAYIEETYGRRLPMVVAVMRDKKVDRVIAALAPAASEFIFTAPATLRAVSPGDLVAVASEVAPGVPAVPITAPMDAISYASTRGFPVVVAGSLYLAGEIRGRLS